jgi:hypothetical protein
MNKDFTFYITIIFLSLIGCTKEGTVTQDQENINPGPDISDHFSFTLYDEMPQSITVPVLSKLEENYARVLRDLNLISMNKVTLKIWSNVTHFLDDMEHDIGIRYPNAAGYVYSSSDIRLLYQWDLPQNSLHEFCHAASMVVNRSIRNNRDGSGRLLLFMKQTNSEIPKQSATW